MRKTKIEYLIALSKSILQTNSSPYVIELYKALAGNWKTTLDKRAANIYSSSSVPQPRLLAFSQTFGC